VRGEAWHACIVEADVECDHDRLGPELAQPAGHLVRLRDGSAADHCACHSCIEQASYGVARTDTAADLQGGPARPGEVRDRAGVALRAIAGPVQVDDVNEARAQRDVLVQHGRRLGGIDGLRVEASLEEPDAASVAEIDRRNELHQPSSRKLASRRAPTRPERSGWN
jgi:hypothetical protein